MMHLEVAKVEDPAGNPGDVGKPSSKLAVGLLTPAALTALFAALGGITCVASYEVSGNLSMAVAPLVAGCSRQLPASPGPGYCFQPSTSPFSTYAPAAALGTVPFLAFSAVMIWLCIQLIGARRDSARTRTGNFQALIASVIGIAVLSMGWLFSVLGLGFMGPGLDEARTLRSAALLTSSVAVIGSAWLVVTAFFAVLHQPTRMN